MAIWVGIGVLGLLAIIGVLRFRRGGSLAERRALSRELREMRDREGPRPAGGYRSTVPGQNPGGYPTDGIGPVGGDGWSGV